MAVKPRPRRDIATAQDVGGLVEIDVAMDIRRHTAGTACWIIGNEQADRHTGRTERLREFNGGIAADRMADDSDWLRVPTIIGNGLIGDTAPAGVGVVARRDTAAIDALRQFVHAPIDLRDQPIEQIGASAHCLLGLSPRVDTCRKDDRRHDG